MEKQEYGVLVYDVPTDAKALYNKIQRQIRKVAIRINLSVYLFQWGKLGKLKDIVMEAQAITGKYASVSYLKFDNSEQEEIERIAKQSLLEEIRAVGRRLREKIQEVEEDLDNAVIINGKPALPDQFVKRTEERLTEAETLAIMFGIADGDMRLALEAVKRVFNAEYDIMMIKRERAKAERQAQQEAGAETISVVAPAGDSGSHSDND